MEKIIATHRMKSDDGTVYEVLEIQSYSQKTFLDGRKQTFPTRKRFELPNGGHVNPLSDGTFQILATDEIIRLT